MLELTLNVTPGNWQKFMARRLSVAFRGIARKIHQRDKSTCRYCGFQANEYMDVLNHDNNYANNTAKNMVTACCFCSQCVFLESIGLDNQSGGQLIYMPEISQNELNNFCHILFCAISDETKYHDTAQLAYRALKARSAPVEKAYGEGSSDPKMLGRLILEYQAEKNKEVVTKALPGLRLLPLQAKFHLQLAAWSQSAMKELRA
jgi:intracellular multiplication protein IcmJ